MFKKKKIKEVGRLTLWESSKIVESKNLREQAWRDAFAKGKKLFTKAEQEKLERYFEDNMIGAIFVEPEMAARMTVFKDMIGKETKHHFPHLRNQIVTKEDERIVRKAWVLADRQGWAPVETFAALKLDKLSEERKKRAYDFARKNKIHMGQAAVLELEPGLREKVDLAIRKYNLRMGDVINTYASFKAPEEVFHIVFNACSKTKANPLEVMQVYLEDLKKRGK